jgi:hypothetical protein
VFQRQGGRLDAHLSSDGSSCFSCFLSFLELTLLRPQLNELQSGRYREGIKEFLVIDCRFDYEYEGGHIDGAINLSEHADIESRLLNLSSPEPSTSECAPRDGKTILIFHCEFSAKRAPTRWAFLPSSPYFELETDPSSSNSAKYLRNQDRLKNFAAYPNIHYPEVYVLQGGYEAFWKAFPVRPSFPFLLPFFADLILLIATLRWWLRRHGPPRARQEALRQSQQVQGSEEAVQPRRFLHLRTSSTRFDHASHCRGDRIDSGDVENSRFP